MKTQEDKIETMKISTNAAFQRPLQVKKSKLVAVRVEWAGYGDSARGVAEA